MKLLAATLVAAVIFAIPLGIFVAASLIHPLAPAGILIGALFALTVHVVHDMMKLEDFNEPYNTTR